MEPFPQTYLLISSTYVLFIQATGASDLIFHLFRTQTEYRNLIVVLIFISFLSGSEVGISLSFEELSTEVGKYKW